MILLFSVLCVLLSNDSSAWSKNWKSQQNSWNISDQKNSGKIVKPKRYLKNFPLQKNRIWPNFRPKNIGRASLARLWPVLSPLELFIKNYSKYTMVAILKQLDFEALQIFVGCFSITLFKMVWKVPVNELQQL